MGTIIKRIKCPVCDQINNSSNIIFKRDFNGIKDIVPYVRYTVYRCDNCDMIYAGDVEESMPLSNYYEMMSKYSGKNFYLITKSNTV